MCLVALECKVLPSIYSPSALLVKHYYKAQAIETQAKTPQSTSYRPVLYGFHWQSLILPYPAKSCIKEEKN